MNLRLLIVNADDFGLSHGVNEGVIRGFEEGIVTSATLMVRGPAVDEAATYARDHDFSVGLHFDLGEWHFEDEEWQARYEVVDLDDADAVVTELARQLDEFQRLVGRDPTHLDSHQHVHRDEPVRSALLDAGNALGVPVRHVTPGITYRGAFYGQDEKGYSLPENVSAGALVTIIGEVEPGVTELGCHPAAADDLVTTYRKERLAELDALCDARVRDALARHEVHPITFADLIELRRAVAAEVSPAGRGCR